MAFRCLNGSDITLSGAVPDRPSISTHAVLFHMAPLRLSLVKCRTTSLLAKHTHTHTHTHTQSRAEARDWSRKTGQNWRQNCGLRLSPFVSRLPLFFRRSPKGRPLSTPKGKKEGRKVYEWAERRQRASSEKQNWKLMALLPLRSLWHVCLRNSCRKRV